MSRTVYELDREFPGLPKGDVSPTLTAWIHDDIDVERKNKFPAMLICPGGGYGGLSSREGEPIASAYFAAGFNCFILRYTIRPDGYYPMHLFQAAASMYMIRTHFGWNNDGRVYVIGFSAGGHLAGTIATRWNDDRLNAFFHCEKKVLRPDGMILSYSVSCCDPDSHLGSFRNYLGGEPTMEQMQEHDLRNFIGPDTPPAFIWHTGDDEAVPVHDALRMAEALFHAGIPTEVHVFPFGPHGMAMSDMVTGARALTRNPYVRRWFDLSLEWIRLISNDRGEA